LQKDNTSVSSAVLSTFFGSVKGSEGTVLQLDSKYFTQVLLNAFNNAPEFMANVVK